MTNYNVFAVTKLVVYTNDCEDAGILRVFSSRRKAIEYINDLTNHMVVEYNPKESWYKYRVNERCNVVLQIKEFIVY